MRGSDIVKERNGYEDLANAVVCVAVEDYRAAYKRYKRGDESARRIIEDDIEVFFRSEWVDSLCWGKAKDIYRRLQKEQEEKKKPKRIAKIT